ncbi:MAG: hypothetical protein EOP04_00245 [Proteobacteria bacterium]|nr:MAG: hypothetical protein EOP04_00245 [Pseudomonadota bacterium]
MLLSRNRLPISLFMLCTIASCRTSQSQPQSKVKDDSNFTQIECKVGEPALFKAAVPGPGETIKPSDFPNIKFSNNLEVAAVLKSAFERNFGPLFMGTILELYVCSDGETVELKRIRESNGVDFDINISKFKVEGLTESLMSDDYRTLKITYHDTIFDLDRMIVGGENHAFVTAASRVEDGSQETFMDPGRSGVEYGKFEFAEIVRPGKNYLECDGGVTAPKFFSGVEYQIRKGSRQYGALKIDYISYVPASGTGTMMMRKDDELAMMCKLTLTDSSPMASTKEPFTYLITNSAISIDYPATHHGWFDRFLLKTPIATYGLLITAEHDQVEADIRQYFSPKGFKATYPDSRTAEFDIPRLPR